MRLSTIRNLYGDAGPWASVYLDATGTHITATPHEARRQFDLRWRAARGALEAEGADEATLRAIDGAVRDAPVHVGPTTVVVLASHGAVALSRTLPVAPQRELANWSAQPHLADLLRVVDSAGSAGALVDPGEGARWVRADVDRTGGSVSSHDGHTTTVRGEDQFVSKVLGGSRDRIWSDGRQQRAAEENWDLNSAEVARAVAAAAARSGADVVILAGDVRARQLVLERLPDPLAACVVQVDHEVDVRPHPDSYLSARREPHVYDSAIEAATKQAVGSVVRERHSDVVDQFHTGLSHGDSVRGVEAVCDAARRLNIATLVLAAEPSHQRVWVDPANPTMVGRSKRGAGSPSAVPEPADDALVGAAAITGAESLVIEADPELAEGLGAILRYPGEPRRPWRAGSHERRTGGPVTG